MRRLSPVGLALVVGLAVGYLAGAGRSNRTTPPSDVRTIEVSRPLEPSGFGPARAEVTRLQIVRVQEGSRTAAVYDAPSDAPAWRVTVGAAVYSAVPVSE